MAIGLRNPQQLGDHRDRERLGDRRDQIELTRAGDRVDQPVGQALHGLAHRLNHARGERLRDEAPNPRVIGRLHVQDAVVDQVPERIVRRGRRGVAHLLVGRQVQVGAPEPPIPQQRVDVVEPRHEPVVGGLVVEHPALFAEPFVDGVGVRDEPDVVRVEAERSGNDVEIHPATVAFRRWPRGGSPSARSRS